MQYEIGDQVRLPSIRNNNEGLGNHFYIGRVVMLDVDPSRQPQTQVRSPRDNTHIHYPVRSGDQVLVEKVEFFKNGRFIDQTSRRPSPIDFEERLVLVDGNELVPFTEQDRDKLLSDWYEQFEPFKAGDPVTYDGYEGWVLLTKVSPLPTDRIVVNSVQWGEQVVNVSNGGLALVERRIGSTTFEGTLRWVLPEELTHR